MSDSEPAENFPTAATVFASGTSGSAEAAWIQANHTYEFRLYGDSAQDLLASTTVTKERAALWPGVPDKEPAKGGAFIEASPNPVPAGAECGKTMINWSTGNGSNGVIHVAMKKLQMRYPVALPTLRYVEYHLVEHCNLSCQRCGHFSPLAKPAYSDPQSFGRDLRQLAKHFSTINRIRLLGGEPLLHPTPEAFVDIAHAIFPNSDIRIVTNGTLLKSMRPSFWEACRRADVKLDFSMYAIMDKARTQLEELCARERVKINVNRYTTFLAGLNPVGDSDPVKSMAYCRKQFYCPFLKNSRLYVCGFPATLHYFNDKFGQAIPDDPGIDIFDAALDGHQILQLLETPVETCRFCSCLYEEHPWKSVRVHQAEEYYVSQVTRDRVASDGGLQPSVVATGRASSFQVPPKSDLPG